MNRGETVEISFRPYWKKEKERFEKEGILPCLDYPMYNDMINGMLFKSFDEILKSEKTSGVAYNPHNNKFLVNFKLYLNEVKRDISKVHSVTEVNLYRIEKRIENLSAIVKRNEGKQGIAAEIFRLYDRLVIVNSFAQFNFETYNHLIKKIAKQFDKIEVKFEQEGLVYMLEDEVFNIFFGDLRTIECLYRLQVLIGEVITQFRGDLPHSDAIEERNFQINKLIEDIDGIRRKKLKGCPPNRLETITKQFEDKKDELVNEIKARGPILGKEDHRSPNRKLPNERNPDEAAGGALLSDRNTDILNAQKGSLLSTGKPFGDVKGEDVPDADIIALDDEEVDSPHNLRNFARYYVDINAGFVQSEAACYNVRSAYFVLAHTFVYMLTYYGITPTTYDYNYIMKIPKNLFGLISAMTPFVAAISCFIYNWQTTVHYKTSYIISLLCLLSGAFLYTLALTYRSIIILFIGRCLFGYGGGRILTRKFFSREISISHRVFFSALLVGVTGVAMTFGPGLSALLETLIDDHEATSTKLKDFKNYTKEQQDLKIEHITSFKIAGMKFARVNYVTGVTTILFLILLIYCIFFFEDTPAKSKDQVEATKHDNSASKLRYQISDIKGMHFLPQDKKSSKYSDNERNTKFDTWKNKMTHAKKYFTDAQTYYVCLFFFVIKAIQECIIVESPAYIVNNYNHTSALSGLIFFLFTFFTLPAALTPSVLKKKYEDRKMLTIGVIILLVVMVLKIQFTKDLYPFGLFIAGSCLVLGMALTVETCCSSIITKVISEKKAQSFMNAGLLAGLIDTLGRVTGSTSITIISTFVEYLYLNCILYPFWFLVLFGVAICLCFMYTRLDTKSYYKFG